MPWARDGLEFAGVLLVSYVDPGASHGFHDSVVFQLAVDLADCVAMQASLHGQLPGAWQPVAWGEVAGSDGEADLVVQLR